MSWYILCVQDAFGENKDKCYIGLFDGYHGKFTAEVAASLLHKMLLHELLKFDSSLSLQPAEPTEQAFDSTTDISHHRFVFGSDARLDGHHDNKTANNNKDKQTRDQETNTTAGDEVPVTIQPDDDELTQRIIELCEHKYGKLLEAMTESSASTEGKPTPPPGKETKKDRVAKHPQEESIAQAFQKSHQLLDILLSYGKDEWSRVRWSGCSTLSVVIESLQQPDQAKQAEHEAQGDDEGEQGDKGDNKKKAAAPPQVQGYIHLANAGLLGIDISLVSLLEQVQVLP